jgi:tetratricopeptide (TPR) repeat protein
MARLENIQDLNELVSTYEAMSQSETVAFAEETVILRIANYYRQTKKSEAALSVIGEGLEQYSSTADLYAFKASLFAEIQQDELALHYLQIALILEPFLPALLLLKAELLIKAERNDEAQEVILLLKTHAKGRELELTFLLEAKLYENIDDYDEMFDALDQVLRRNPRNMEALHHIWIAAELSGRYEDSIDLHEWIIDEDPYSYLAWLNLGHAQLCLEEYEAAIEAYEFALVINENCELSYRECATVYLQLQNYRKALEMYQEYLQHFKADSDIYAKMGFCQQRLGEHTSAMLWYRKALQLDKNNDEVLFRMGECLALQGNLESAAITIQRAIDIDNAIEEYFYALGQILSILGECEKASTAFCRANEIAPENTKFWIGHAKFYRELANHDMALEIINEAELNVMGADLLYSRVICLFEMGNRKEALSYLHEALVEDFRMHEMLFQELPYLEHDREVQSLIYYCQQE